MLTKKQLTTITVNSITVKMLITYPRVLFELCGNAAWISLIYCTLIAVLLFGLIRKVYKSDGNVIQTAEKAGGSVLRIITGLSVFVVMAVDFFSLIRIFPEIIRLVLLQGTYSEIIGITFAIALILGATCGIESIGRVHSLFIPIAGGILVVFFLLLIPTVEVDNIFPILGTGAENLFFKGISGLSVFSDLLMLNILIPMTNTVQNYKTTGTKAIAIGGVCIILITLAYGLCYAYPATTNFFAPVYQLERLIHLSNFFSRFEAGFQFIWSISILLYGSLYLAVLSEVWKQSFNLKHSKPLLLPIMTLLVGLALIPNNLNTMTTWEAEINKWLFIPVFAIPLIIGMIERIKNVSRETLKGEKR